MPQNRSASGLAAFVILKRKLLPCQGTSEVNTVATEAIEDPNRGLIYRVLLSSDKDYFMVEERKISLIPGMAVTAEIKTRQKRVIEYFLEPFKTYASEGLRER